MSETLFGEEPTAGETSGHFARVILERGIDAPEGLTYAIPASMADLAVGERVGAPLGRGDATAHGYVIEITDHADLDPRRIKSLRSRAGVRATRGLVELARWMAAYYCCPLGMVFAAMVPAAVKRQTGRIKREVVVRATDDDGNRVAPEGRLTPKVAEAFERLEALDDRAFPIEAKALARRLELRTVGPINRLVEAGVLRTEVRVSVRAPLFETPDEPDAQPELTADQLAAADAVIDSAERFQPFLLHGVTGSGKTEVYLRIIDRVLGRGESAIVLVPEISLTPQTAGRFIRRFRRIERRTESGEVERLEHPVAVLHSGLTASQRHQQWTRIASGEARVVIGARSAIFAPFPEGGVGRLGVIIVDEEHDGSYKQDQLPRYHARDVALKRGHLEGRPVLLGSATPSLESYRNARLGRSVLLSLPERVGGGVLPKVEIVDLGAEADGVATRQGSRPTLGPRLTVQLQRTLNEGGQTILLLNRRGYASYIACPSATCGWRLSCDQCDATLVHHRATIDSGGGSREYRIVRCHHCLAHQKLPVLCPTCGLKLIQLGFGTQRLEEELAGRFHELVLGETMLRLDSDSMQSARDYFDALERFRKGEVRLLMGTQMIAKGLDFPNVRLIGVVNADTSLHLPDFRAAERTFQLIAQVAGRAGRSGASAGRALVIVQTMNPQDPSIRSASRHDYIGFAERELGVRERAKLPPSTRMVRVVCRDEDPDRAMGRGREIADALRVEGGAAVHVEGPMPCHISRIAGYARIAVEMTASSSGPLQRAMAALRNRDLLRSDRQTAVDVDPVSLL